MNDKKYENQKNKLIRARGQHKVILHEKFLGRELDKKNR